jgi:hypothetical protein
MLATSNCFATEIISAWVQSTFIAFPTYLRRCSLVFSGERLRVYQPISAAYKVFEQSGKHYQALVN